MRIKITKDGPYWVSGGIPIREMFIVPKGSHYVLEEGRPLPQAEGYALCRCGKSKNKPFCDGNHEAGRFDGAETADRKPFRQRVQSVTFGRTMNLLDDGRCAFARFCHTEHGDIWSITEKDLEPEKRQAAIQSAGECPSGRLVMVDKEGTALEEDFTPEIIIMQDPQQNASAAIFVKGPVTVEAADGTEYEVRNRVALCRCGKSQNKPFCDASHIQTGFDDGYLSRAARP